MPIGTSSGEYYEDQYDYTVRREVINPDVTPEFMTNDQNVIHPDQMSIKQQLDKSEQDPSTGTGIPIGLKRVEITGGTIDSTMPLEASTEPADALESEEGSRVVLRVDWTKMNQPFGSIKGTAPEDTPVAFKTPNITITEGDINRAIDVGMGAGPGIFQGIKSKAFDKNLLAQAQILEQKGFDRDEIWTRTGVFKGADGRWRQEINDSKAIAKPQREADLDGKSLEDVLDHPELFKAYPDLRHIEVVPFKEDTYGRAAYNATNDTIELGKNFQIEDILHEVQHAIQKREGFAKGGSPAEEFALRFEEDLRIAKIEANQLRKYRESDSFKGWTKEDEGRIKELKRLFEVEMLRKGVAFKEAEEQYMRLAGEVEARNVETRGELNANARREIPPWLTEDTARNLQTVIDEPMWTTPYGPTKTPGVAPQYAPPREFRRGANDNLPEGHPDRPYNVREPGMIGGAAMDKHVEDTWKFFADSQRKSLEAEEILRKPNFTEIDAARVKKLQKEAIDLMKKSNDLLNE